MEKSFLINSFAIRSFRDVADADYVAARMAFRARLNSQFLWSGLQAIEKYLKCILLLNRVKAKYLQHDLGEGLRLVKQCLPFDVRLREPSEKLVAHLDTYGRFRYLEAPYHVDHFQLPELDMAVWDLRRYCQIINYEIDLSNGQKKPMLDLEIKKIEESEKLLPQAFKLIGGTLEKIIEDKNNPAREPLLWQNLFFGKRARKGLRVKGYMHYTNVPLLAHPEILDEILMYIKLPKDAITAYRAALVDQSCRLGPTK